MYLIDTDIIIYSLKGVTSVTDNFESHANAPKAISVISYGELVYGAQKSMQVPSNLAKVNRIKEIFPIIDLSPSIMDCFGLLKAQLSKNGITVDDFDLLIGATAITYGYTIVTNNEKHFSKIPDLSIENWNQ
ncbi:MAG: VapC toxin family PIN domain ribonuclease [Gammaproteobacteria bacterium]|nr:MAG: VapC toxin family PIN domain ribonuclease [Gammaproteobacteria bacterium]